MGGRSVGDGERDLRRSSSARHDAKLVSVPTRREVSKALELDSVRQVGLWWNSEREFKKSVDSGVIGRIEGLAIGSKI
jgi:hypothetical protein